MAVKSILMDDLEILSGNDLSAIERIILASTGTVQSLLSAIFLAQVQVEVISQMNYDTVLVRWVRLVVDKYTVALAESVIPYKKNNPEFIGAMGDRDIGIGQAIANLKIYTKRSILGIHVDNKTLSRTYRIEGAAIDVLITEIFDRELYREPK